MKTFGPSFKPLHNTGMGPSSGMSEGLGSELKGVIGRWFDNLAYPPSGKM
jgi:hypothetical protein